MNYVIRALTIDDIDLLYAHSARALGESGKPGTPYFHIYDSVSPWTPVPEKTRERWTKPLTELGWSRTWGLFATEESGTHIRGAVSMISGDYNSNRHRPSLALGVERDHRGKGLGEKLMRTAIEWTRNPGDASTRFDYVDLFVFMGNEPAIRLYEKLGFREIGRCADRWRIDGTSLGDIHFTLPLRSGIALNP